MGTILVCALRDVLNNSASTLERASAGLVLFHGFLVLAAGNNELQATTISDLRARLDLVVQALDMAEAHLGSKH